MSSRGWRSIIGSLRSFSSSDDRDPLGRSDGNYGDSVDAGQDKVPLELERQRSREILDELRRRAGEQLRPKEELDYIDRLLKTY